MNDKAINNLLTALPPRTRELAQHARVLLRSTLPGVTEVTPSATLIGYRIGKGTGVRQLVCALDLAGADLKIIFYACARLPDPHDLLAGPGRAHRYVLVRSDEELGSAALHELLVAALRAFHARTGDIPTPETGMSFADLCAAAAQLPAVKEAASYGTPALKVGAKLMLRLIDNGTAVALKCSWDERERLLAASPSVFYITPHYQAYPWVLIRLGRLNPHSAAPLLEMAWQQAATATLRNRRNALP